MDPGMQFFVLLVGVLVPVFGLVWWFSPEQKAKRLLRSVRAIPANTAMPGQIVKISGTLHLLEHMDAPLSGLPCAYWRILIEVPYGKNSWRTVVDDSLSMPFLVDDGSGEVVQVAPGKARLVVDTERVGAVGALDNPTDSEAALLRRYKLTETVMGFNKRYRFTESTLHEGEVVSVHGEVTLDDTGGGTRLVMVAPPGGQLLVCDSRGVHD